MIVLPNGFKDTYADYRPKFGKMEPTRVRNNRAGHSVAMGYPDSYAAITWENGDIVITIDAFLFSPGYLAAVVEHETIHFDQFTTPGRGDKMSPLAREREAYNVMLGPANANILKLSHAEVKTVNERFEKAKRNASSNLNGTMIGASGFYSIDLTQNPDGEDLLLQTMREARESAAKQKELAEQANHRDHDDRLKDTLAAMARKSCANPGSVTQADLDGLPKPYDVNYLHTDYPSGLDNCATSVYTGLLYGGDAEEIRSKSIPVAAAVYPPEVKPVDARLGLKPSYDITPAPVAVSAKVQPQFWMSLPFLKDLSVKACGTADEVPFDKTLTAPRTPFEFSQKSEDIVAERLSAGLGECENRLFARLILEVRRGNGGDITGPWIRAIAAKYRSDAGTTSGYPSPQTGGGDPCRDHGNIRCP